MAASASLEVLLKLRDELSSEVKKAAGAFGELQSKAAGVRGEIGNLIGKAASLTPLAGAATALAGAFSLKEAIGTANELGAEIIRLQRETGLSAEAASQLHFAWQETGVSFESGEKGIKKFSQALAGVSDLSDGVTIPIGKQMQQLLKEIGVTGNDAAGNIRPMTDVLGDVAEKFKEMGPGADSTALSVKLFGKSGMDLLPFLFKGRDGLKELSSEASKFGLVLDQKTLDAMKKQKIASREFHAALEGISVQIGVALLPIMTKLAEGGTMLAIAFNEHVVPAITRAGEVLNDFIQLIVAGVTGDVGKAAELFNKLPEPLQKIALWLGKNKDAIEDFITAAADLAKNVGLDALEGWKSILMEVGPLLVQFAGYLKDNKPALIAFGVALGVVAIAIGGIPLAIAALIVAIGLLAAHWDEIKQKTQEVWKAINDATHGILGDIVNDIRNQLKLLIDVVTTELTLLKDIFKIVMAVIHGDWGAAWQGIKQLFSDAWDGIRLIFADAVEMVKGEMQLILDVVAYIGGAILNWFKDLGSSILSSLGDLSSLLTDVGSQVVQGFWDGLKSKWDDVKNWVQGVPGDIVNGFKSAFGINSPATTMIPIGEALIEGIQVGVSNKMGDLLAQLSQVANFVQDSLDHIAAMSARDFSRSVPNQSDGSSSAPTDRFSRGNGDGSGHDPNQMVGGHTRDEWKFIFGASGIPASEYEQRLREMFGYKMGGVLPSDGWFYGHKGEEVRNPALGQTSGNHTAYVTLNINGDVSDSQSNKLLGAVKRMLTDELGLETLTGPRVPLGIYSSR